MTTEYEQSGLGTTGGGGGFSLSYGLGGMGMGGVGGMGMGMGMGMGGGGMGSGLYAHEVYPSHQAPVNATWQLERTEMLQRYVSFVLKEKGGRSCVHVHVHVGGMWERVHGVWGCIYICVCVYV
jgi:hypothetical protein